MYQYLLWYPSPLYETSFQYLWPPYSYPGLACSYDPPSSYYMEPLNREHSLLGLSKRVFQKTTEKAQEPCTTGRIRTSLRGNTSTVQSTLNQKKSRMQGFRAPTKTELKYKFPSVIMKLLTFASKPHQSLDICKRVFSQLSPLPLECLSVDRYYIFFKHIRTNLARHENFNTLIHFDRVRPELLDLFGEEEQLFYLKVARILMHHYLKELMPACILRSTKIAPKNRLEHLRIRRELVRLLYGE